LTRIVKYESPDQLVPGAIVHIDTGATYRLTDGKVQSADTAIVIYRKGEIPRLVTVFQSDLFTEHFFIRHAEQVTPPDPSVQRQSYEGWVEFVEVNG
jgi:hypothetical protein